MQRTVMRRLVLSLTIGLIVLTAACDNEALADSGRTSQWPAGAAGVMCQLLEYDVVADKLGIRFDTAGGASQDDTLTCALTQAGEDYPYLTLALTPSAIDTTIFASDATPAGAVAVPELGTAAYQLAVAAADPAGPAVEVCWLSTTGRMMIMRYAFDLSATGEDVETLTPKLLALAKQIEKALPA